MSTKEFSLGAIITVMTGRQACDHQEYYDLVCFMTGEILYNTQLMRAWTPCSTSLRRQHSALSEKIDSAFDELTELTKGSVDNETALTIFDKWYKKLSLEHGETLSVEPLVPGEYIIMDINIENEALVGKERYIAVEVSRQTMIDDLEVLSLENDLLD